MTEKPKLPDQAAIDRSVVRLRETCRQLEALTIFMDDAIAQIEAENRKSPLYVYRLERAKKLLPERFCEKLEEKGTE